MDVSKNIFLKLEYDGTCYHGWQVQQNALSVQETVEEAIQKAAGERVELYGCGRTDAGVHALGFTANFHTISAIPPEKFAHVLNSVLPSDIAVKESREIPEDFHARFSARAKRYMYLIYNNIYPSPLYLNRACHIKKNLDFESMKKGAEFFIGTHDFSAFKAAGSNVKNNIRTVYDVSLRHWQDLIILNIHGNGFLYNMVRIITGTLVNVGLGKINYSAVPAIIKSGKREMAGKTMPPQGLYLVEVEY